MLSGLSAPGFARMTITLPSGRLRERKISPFGATRITRAPSIPVTKGATEKPGIVLSTASAGLGNHLRTIGRRGCFERRVEIVHCYLAHDAGCVRLPVTVGRIAGAHIIR